MRQTHFHQYMCYLWQVPSALQFLCLKSQNNITVSISYVEFGEDSTQYAFIINMIRESDGILILRPQMAFCQDLVSPFKLRLVEVKPWIWHKRTGEPWVNGLTSVCLSFHIHTREKNAQGAAKHMVDISKYFFDEHEWKS